MSWLFTKCSIQNTVKWRTACIFGIRHQLPNLAWRLKMTYITNTHTHTYTVQCVHESVFSVQYVPTRTVQLFYKQSEKNHTCQSRFWFTAASRHDWTSHHIILYKCQERWGQGDPVHVNCRTQNIVLGFLSAGRASQTVPGDLRLKLDRLHTSLPFHAVIRAIFFFFYLSNSCLSVCLSPPVSVITRCVITAFALPLCRYEIEFLIKSLTILCFHQTDQTAS